MSMRVLHVIASLSPVHGGTTSSVLQMIAAIEAQSVTCEIATSDDDGLGRRLRKDAPERRLPGRHYFAKRRDFYGHTPAMGPWLQANAARFDLVHIHGLFSYVNGLAGRICRRQRVPYVVTPHGMARRYGMRHKPLMKKVSFALVERALLDGAVAVHMTSRSEERDFVDLGIRTPVVRVPLAVAPVPLGDGSAFRARHAEIGDRRILVFMGRLNPVKNLEAAIDALALPGGAGFQLAICGQGEAAYSAELRARAGARGVADRISWLGFVEGQAKADVLAAAEVYLQPSLSESFGVAAVEAVSAGLPCVLGEDVAIAEDLVAAGFAVAVPPNGERIAAAIIDAIALRARTPQFQQAARDFVCSHFDGDSIGRDLVGLYSRICSRDVLEWSHASRPASPMGRS